VSNSFKTSNGSNGNGDRFGNFHSGTENSDGVAKSHLAFSNKESLEIISLFFTLLRKSKNGCACQIFIASIHHESKRYLRVSILVIH